MSYTLPAARYVDKKNSSIEEYTHALPRFVFGSLASRVIGRQLGCFGKFQGRHASYASERILEQPDLVLSRKRLLEPDF